MLKRCFVGFLARRTSQVIGVVKSVISFQATYLLMEKGCLLHFSSRGLLGFMK